MSQKKKSKAGRPSYQPQPEDRGRVRALAMVGIPRNEIAATMQLSLPTLRKHFAQELKAGPVEANANVARSLYRAATDPVKPNVVAAIFWLKARAGWIEAQASKSPVQMILPPLGKKAQANEDAKSAQAGTDWDDLLPQPSPETVQ